MSISPGKDPSIIKDMEVAGIENAEGVNFSVPRKSEMASLLKQRMGNQKLFYPLLNWEKPYRGDICTELNVERLRATQRRRHRLFPPRRNPRRRLLGTALACFATVEMQAFDIETLRFGERQ